MEKLKTIELFTGIGGVTGGFLDTNKFEPVFLNDMDLTAKKAFEFNFPSYSEIYNTQNIKELTVEFIKEFTNDDYDGILGCPPCQGLSMAGLRKVDDERNKLINEFQHLILGLEPKFFVMENVPGLLKSDYFKDFYENTGYKYNMCFDVLNAAEYGIPQLRRRAVVIGFHKDYNVYPTLPKRTHGGEGEVFDYFTGKYVDLKDDNTRKTFQLKRKCKLPQKNLVTLEDALGDLPEQLKPGEEQHEYAKKPETTFQRIMRRKAGKILKNHRAWEHSQEMINRMKKIKPGDSPIQHGSRSRNKRYFSQAYSRLHPGGLSRTVTTNFPNPGGGRYTHYSSPRTITLREALRIQSFPDTFVFDHNDVYPTDAKRMIGNAFPRLLAKKIATDIYPVFDNN